MKTLEQQRARELRASGWSIKEIERSLGVSRCRNALSIVNSDPELLEIFVRFVRDEFGVPPERFRVCCNLFADHVEQQREIEKFWLNRLELIEESLTKTTINVYSSTAGKSGSTSSHTEPAR